MIQFSSTSPRRRKFFRYPKQRDGVRWIAIGIPKQGHIVSLGKTRQEAAEKAPVRSPESCITQPQEAFWRKADLVVLSNPAEQSFGFAFGTLQALAEHTSNKRQAIPMSLLGQSTGMDRLLAA